VQIRPPLLLLATTRKKEMKGKERYHTIWGYISAIWGADHFGPISTKIGRVEGSYYIIILSNFGFNTFRGFRSTGGQNLHLPIDFAGHRYNSAAATAQPVTRSILLKGKTYSKAIQLTNLESFNYRPLSI